MSKFEQPRIPPIELIRKGDEKQTVVAYACSKCGRVNQKEFAERCCAGYICEECGKPTGGAYRTLCSECWLARENAKTLERAEKATKIPIADYSGPVWCEGIGYNDGFFEDTDELIDYCADEEITSLGPVFACHVTKFAVDADDAIDAVLEEFPEGSEASHVDELRTFLDGWNAKQDAEMWEPDHSLVVTGIEDEMKEE